jgi:hypothetical protein
MGDPFSILFPVIYLSGLFPHRGIALEQKFLSGDDIFNRNRSGIALVAVLTLNVSPAMSGQLFDFAGWEPG